MEAEKRREGKAAEVYKSLKRIPVNLHVMSFSPITKSRGEGGHIGEI